MTLGRDNEADFIQGHQEKLRTFAVDLPDGREIELNPEDSWVSGTYSQGVLRRSVMESY